MQVAQIITEQEPLRLDVTGGWAPPPVDLEVRNARELARAFTGHGNIGRMWMRIANHFVTTNNIFGGSLGDDRGEVEGRMQRINREVGAEMSERLTPVRWNTLAARYGMNTDKTRPTWQDIYNHLRPYAEADLPENWTVAGTGSGAGTQVNSTREQSFEIGSWVPTDRVRFENENQLREYMNAWFDEVIANRRPERFGLWLNTRQNPNDPQSTPVRQSWHQWRRIRNETIPAEITANGSVTKERVDSFMYAWLTAADTAFAAFQRRQNQ